MSLKKTRALFELVISQYLRDKHIVFVRAAIICLLGAEHYLQFPDISIFCTLFQFITSLTQIKKQKRKVTKVVQKIEKKTLCRN